MKELKDFSVGDVGSYLPDKSGFSDSVLVKTIIEWKDCAAPLLYNAGWRPNNSLKGGLAFHNKKFVCIRSKLDTKVFIYKADKLFFLYVCIFEVIR